MTKDKFKDSIQNIKLLISDVDGVLTDGRILINSNGTESKYLNVEDGTGTALAFYADLPIALISGRYSECTKIRARELKIKHCFQDTLNKKIILDKLTKIYSVKYHEIAYIGDGLVDLPILELVGLPIAVPNGHIMAKNNSSYITSKLGGEGVLLEVVEMILKYQGRYDDILNIMKERAFEKSVK